jgi:hypothetical protein
MSSGLRWITPGVVVAKPLRFNPPVPADGWWYFQSGATDSRRNLISKALASAVGSPTFDAQSVTLKAGVSGNAHLVTDVVETTAMSGLAVVRAPDAFDGTNATLPVWLGSQDGSGAALRGLSLIVRGAGRDALTWVTNVSGTPTSDYVQAAAALPDMLAYRCIAFATDGLNYDLYDLTNNLFITKQNSNARILGGAGTPFKIGNVGLSARTGRGQFAAVALRNAYMTADQFAAAYASVKAYMASLATPIAV